MPLICSSLNRFRFSRSEGRILPHSLQFRPVYFPGCRSESSTRLISIDPLLFRRRSSLIALSFVYCYNTYLNCSNSFANTLCDYVRLSHFVSTNSKTEWFPSLCAGKSPLPVDQRGQGSRAVGLSPTQNFITASTPSALSPQEFSLPFAHDRSSPHCPTSQ